jgi:type VI secretion system Hcp family effector
MPGFARIGDIKGSVTMKGFVGELEFNALRFAAAGGEQTAPRFDHITLTRFSDLASPSLLRALHSGSHIEEARLSIVRVSEPTSGTFMPTLVITLGEVTVTRVQTVWKEEGPPTEEIALGYRRLSWSAHQVGGETVSFSVELPSPR